MIDSNKDCLKNHIEQINCENKKCKLLGIDIVYKHYGFYCFKELHHIETGVCVRSANHYMKLTDLIDWLMEEVAKHNENAEPLNDE